MRLPCCILLIEKTLCTQALIPACTTSDKSDGPDAAVEFFRRRIGLKSAMI
ncbi:MAG: hypothetical protein IJ016_05905 [Elusimicrobiaceae bacterium]|nr:hypothetical protein [Elusimicrobiaceae bacterium]